MSRMVIVISLADRPEYARQALDALRACQGIENCLLLPHVEPGNEEMRSLVVSIDFCECWPAFNRERLGPTRNIRVAWRDGFGQARAYSRASDYVLLIEEDVILAPDALEYHAWARDRFRDDPTIFSVTAYNRRPDPCPPELHHVVRRRPWFHPWGTGLWANRWALVDGLPEEGGTWDTIIHREAVERLGLHEIYPELARCNNIGLHTTVHDPVVYTPEWYREHHWLVHWHGTHDVTPGEWTDANDLRA